MNASICRKFGLQTKEFGKILLLFTNPAWGEGLDLSHLPYPNTNATFFLKITKETKAINRGTAVVYLRLVVS